MNNQNQITNIIIDFNPWWKGGYDISYKPRLLYGTIQKYIPLRQIIAITGLRRTGKTTLMKKAILDILRQGEDSRAVFYFSFDEIKNIQLRELLDIYANLARVNIVREKIYLFFDEIQKLKDWASQIKAVYDLYPAIKIFISGSESLFIKTSKESLAGRMFEFKLRPLSFYEYLDFKAFRYDLSNPSLYDRDMKRLFEEYLFTSGFPELVDTKDAEIIKKYLYESVIEKIIYKDIPIFFSVKDPAALETIMKILIDNPGQMISLNEIAQELGVSRQSASAYLRYLEMSYLIRKVYNFSTNRRKIERKLKRYYPEIFSLSFMSRDDALRRSRVFENAVISHMEGEFFYRDAYQHEIDLVLAGEDIIPVEVKYGKIDLKNMKLFLGRFNLKRGIVLTMADRQHIKEKDYEIDIMPAYEYFLMGRF